MPRVETDSSGDEEQKAWNANREEQYLLKRRVKAAREAFPAVLDEFRPLLKKAGFADEARLREVVKPNRVDKFVQDLQAVRGGGGAGVTHLKLTVLCRLVPSS